MFSDEERRAGGYGAPLAGGTEKRNKCGNILPRPTGEVKPVQSFYLLPGDPICASATAWLITHRQRRVFWIADGVDHVSAGLVLLASDEVIVATGISDALGRGAEAATAPDRTISVVVAPAERADEWITVARWCGLTAARFA